MGAACRGERMKAPLVSMSDISKVFGAVRALSRATLTIGADEVLGLVGDNAAGKSTLMKILTALASPNSGTIAVSGQTVLFRGPNDARAVGIEMIYQISPWFPR